jgi:hypothetical protein
MVPKKQQLKEPLFYWHIVVVKEKFDAYEKANACRLKKLIYEMLHANLIVNFYLISVIEKVKKEIAVS